MLKCILLLLSEYYYGIAESRLGEICDKVNEHQVHVTLKRTDQYKREETLVITDKEQTEEIRGDERVRVCVGISA